MDWLLNNKTLLFNLAFGTLSIATAILGNLGYVEFEPTPEVAGLVVALVALVNAVAKIVVDKQKA